MTAHGRRRAAARAPAPRAPCACRTDQPLGDLAVLLLEPASPDSFFQWGFFLEALQPTEYVEGYVMEPMAERDAGRGRGAAGGVRAAVAADRRASPAARRARLQWLYARTPFFDERAGLYPVFRER